MNDIEKLIKFFHYTEGLKREMRNLVLSDKRQESTADHSWRMAFMIMVVAKKIEMKFDSEKALKMALIHDLVEIDAKDTPFYAHFQNEVAKKDKKMREDKAINNIKKMLGDDGDEIFDLWNEYEEQMTNEAKIVKAMDKLESRLQFIEGDQLIKQTTDEQTFKQAGDYFDKTIAVDPFLAKLGDATREERDKKYEDTGEISI